MYAYLTHSRILFEKLAVTELVKNSSPFLKPEISLPWSQQLPTGPSHELSLYILPAYVYKINFSIILSHIPVFLSGFPPKLLYAFLIFMYATCPTHIIFPISFSW